MTTILGYVMSRDEWPMLGVAITHALEVVDHIVVVDHASVDNTQAGLRHLQQQYPDRLTILKVNDPEFLEEATTRVIMKACAAEDYDWVYIFDADEFLLTKQGSSLRSILSGVAPDVDAMRYQVQNWICPTDFDPTAFGRFTKSFQRSMPSRFKATSPSDMVQMASKGQINFFDIPFESKLIARSKRAFELSVGSHSLKSKHSFKEVSVDAQCVSCAHLPFYSFERLERKALRGKNLVQSGAPPEYGWQSQVIYRAQQQGKLEEFWEAHTIPARQRPLAFKIPDSCVDDSLAREIDKALERFDPGKCLPDAALVNAAKQLDMSPLIKDVFNLIETINKQEHLLLLSERRLKTRIKSRIDRLRYNLNDRLRNLLASKNRTCLGLCLLSIGI